jgi:hypothetical protein
LAWAQLTRVANHQLLSNLSQFWIGERLAYRTNSAASAKAFEVIFQAKKAVAKGATQVRDRGSKDETGVVKWQACLGLRNQPSVQVCHRLGH